MRPAENPRRPTLKDKIGLWLSINRRIDGLWVGTLESGDRSETVLRRVEEALRLIKTYDRLRYDRLLRDLERVWVLVLPGSLGSYDERLRACRLDARHVLAEGSSPEMIAATIVHEATHARLSRCGIGYHEELRSRVEKICFRREIAFAAKLPNGEQVREQAERSVQSFAAHDCWTDAALDARNLDGSMDALRHLGAPRWLVRAIPLLLALRRLRRRNRRPQRMRSTAPANRLG